MSSDRVGILIAGKLDGTIESQVHSMSDGYSGYLITMESGMMIYTIDLFNYIFVFSGFADSMLFLPYLSIGANTGDIRVMEDYSFHSLGSKWQWYSDSIDGFILYNSENDVFFTLFGTNKPDYFNFSGKENVEYFEAGKIEVLVDIYKVPISYATFRNDDAYFINIEMPIDKETHYAQIAFPNLPDVKVDELITTESFLNLFSTGLHIGKRYLSNRESLIVHLQIEE